MCYRFCAEIALILNYKSQHAAGFHNLVGRTGLEPVTSAV